MHYINFFHVIKFFFKIIVFYKGNININSEMKWNVLDDDFLFFLRNN